jgi:hypothetical protein
MARFQPIAFESSVVLHTRQANRPMNSEPLTPTQKNSLASSEVLAGLIIFRALFGVPVLQNPGAKRFRTRGLPSDALSRSS